MKPWALFELLHLVVLVAALSSEASYGLEKRPGMKKIPDHKRPFHSFFTMRGVSNRFLSEVNVIPFSEERREGLFLKVHRSFDRNTYIEDAAEIFSLEGIDYLSASERTEILEAHKKLDPSQVVYVQGRLSFLEEDLSLHYPGAKVIQDIPKILSPSGAGGRFTVRKAALGVFAPFIIRPGADGDGVQVAQAGLPLGQEFPAKDGPSATNLSDWQIATARNLDPRFSEALSTAAGLTILHQWAILKASQPDLIRNIAPHALVTTRGTGRLRLYGRRKFVEKARTENTRLLSSDPHSLISDKMLRLLAPKLGLLHRLLPRIPLEDVIGLSDQVHSANQMFFDIYTSEKMPLPILLIDHSRARDARLEKILHPLLIGMGESSKKSLKNIVYAHKRPLPSESSFIPTAPVPSPSSAKKALPKSNFIEIRNLTDLGSAQSQLRAIGLIADKYAKILRADFSERQLENIKPNEILIREGSKELIGEMERLGINFQQVIVSQDTAPSLLVPLGAIKLEAGSDAFKVGYGYHQTQFNLNYPLQI